MLDDVGFSATTYEDFADQTFSLLEELATSLSKHDDGNLLLTTFNDLGISSAITFHFRVGFPLGLLHVGIDSADLIQLLTSAWMKMYPQVYAGFLAGMDVDAYCTQNILPAAIELDHLGLQCLATSVINEAGIAIEVLYLDRSEGKEVNTHRFPVLDGDGKVVEEAPTIRLLYRP